MAANHHHTTDGPDRLSPVTDQLPATGTATSTAAPERARWPRLAAAPQPPLRSLLPRGYAGFTEATAPRHLVLPATTSVPLVVKLADSAHRPPAFVMGAHGTSTVLEGECAPSYFEVLLAPLGAYTLLGLPMEQLSGQTVDLVEVLGADGRRLDWGQVAAEVGYADQAHLVRDFHQFTGATPTAFAALTRPPDGDREQQVNSVQDAVAAAS